MPSVSVIVPVYNTEAYLRECLESIVTQTHRDIEVVCVNDGSTDGSVQILREYAAKDDRVTVVDHDNRGLTRARNEGFDLTSGDYVIFLDSDDYFEPTMIEELYAQCVRDDAEIAVSRIRYVYVASGTSLVASWSLRTDLLPDFTPFSRADIASDLFLAFSTAVWNKMFKRSFLVDHGIRFHPDLRSAEDVPFTYLAVASARRITIVDKPLVNYRTGRPLSLIATTHERPLEICEALRVSKGELEAAGIYAQVERDFLNAALRELLFTLETLKTLEGFRALFGALKGGYLVDLGIAGRSPEEFASTSDCEWCSKLASLTLEEYLIEHRNSLKRELTATRTHSAWNRAQLANYKARTLEAEDRLADAKARLKLAKAQLSRIRRSRSYRIGRALTFVPRRLKRVFVRSPKAQ